MKPAIPAMLLIAGLAAAPTALHAQADAASPDAASSDTVSFGDAVQCSALHTLIAGSVDDAEKIAESQAIATRWLVVAMARDGTSDGSGAEAALEPSISEWIEALEASASETEGARIVTNGLQRCKAKQAEIAAEFAGIELD